MAIIQLHTPKGIVDIDSDIVTDVQLAALGITRTHLEELIPHDLGKEIDALKAITANHEIRLSKNIGGHSR